MDVSLKVFLTAFLYQPCEVELVSDAFSTQAPMDLRFAQSSLLAVQEVYSEVLKKKCTLTATEEEIQKVVDLWCEQEGVQSTCGEGKLSYRVRYTLCLLYRGKGGAVLPDHRLVALGQFADEFIALGGFGGLQHLLIGGAPRSGNYC